MVQWNSSIVVVVRETVVVWYFDQLWLKGLSGLSIEACEALGGGSLGSLSTACGAGMVDGSLSTEACHGF